MADYCLSSTLSDLKTKILDLSADLISSNFTLANMGKEIDMDDARTLADVGILDGDILTLVPARVWEFSVCVRREGVRGKFEI